MAKEVKPPTAVPEQRTNQTTSHSADPKPHTSDNQEINTGNVAQKSGSEAGSPKEANEQGEKARQERAQDTEVKRGANEAGEDDVKPAQVENEPEEVKRSLPARLRRRLARRTNNPNMSERHAKPNPITPIVGPVPLSTGEPAEPAVAAKPVSPKTCSHCSGTGLNPDDYGKLCAYCDGKGVPRKRAKA